MASLTAPVLTAVQSRRTCPNAGRPIQIWVVGKGVAREAVFGAITLAGVAGGLAELAFVIRV